MFEFALDLGPLHLRVTLTDTAPDEQREVDMGSLVERGDQPRRDAVVPDESDRIGFRA